MPRRILSQWLLLSIAVAVPLHVHAQQTAPPRPSAPRPVSPRSTTPSKRTRAEQRYRSGLAKMSATPADIAGAAEDFRQAAIIDGSYTPPRLALALMEESAGNVKAAVPLLESVANARDAPAPLAAEAREALARVNRFRESQKSAAACQSLLVKASEAADAGKMVDAMTTLDAATRADASCWEASVLAAALALRLERFDKAATLLANVAASAPAEWQDAIRLMRERVDKAVTGRSRPAQSEELQFFQLLQGNPNPAAWEFFVQKFPDGPYTERARAQLLELTTTKYAHLEGTSTMALLMAEIGLSASEATCTVPGLRPGDISHCYSSFSVLSAGDHGFCEAQVGVTMSSSDAKHSCDTEIQDDYRFSLAGIDPGTITVDGARVVLRSTAGINRKSFRGQRGLGCQAGGQETNSVIPTVAVDFGTAAKAEEAKGKVLEVATFCRDISAPAR